MSVRGLSVAFGPTRALRGVDLDVGPGEVVALVGENGAGKSTLIKVLAGVQRPTAGDVTIDGSIAFVHQDLGLLEPLSVAENIAHLTGFERRGGLISWRRQRARAREVLEQWGIDIPPDAPVGGLDPGQRALVAIARALAVDARVIVLDEPTAALPRHDVDVLLSAVERLRDAGVGFLYVTHRLDEVSRLADRVVVLRDGRRVADVPAAETSAAEVVRLIVGSELADDELFLNDPAPDVVLELAGVEAAGVHGVSLSVRRGEIVGLVGLVGAGQREVGRIVGGAAPATAGQLLLHGDEFRPRSPRDAVRRGVAYVPADRLREGGFVALDTGTNLVLRAGGSGVRLRPDAEQRAAVRVLDAWSVTPSAPSALFSALSGGNQQKLLLAKWIEAAPRLLVVDEPTAGVDVGARQAIHHRLAGASAAGVATLLISSDTEEVAGLAHRALVFKDGRVASELAGDRLDVEQITLAGAGDWGGRTDG